VSLAIPIHFSKCGLNVYNEENNKRKRILFCRLLTTLANNITTNECMYHTVIKSGIVTETSDNLVHSYASTSKHAKLNTIMSAKSTDDILQLTRVKCPMFTHGIHITFQHIVRRSTERVKKIRRHITHGLLENEKSV